MNKAEHNFRLLQEIEENRRFLLQIYVQNPELLKTADARIKPLLAPLPIEKSAVSTRQRGISLIELIMFIVIVSVALAGILLVMNVTTKGSADPLIHKQAIAAAESLLEEIELQDFIAESGVPNAVTQANRASEYHIVSNYNTSGGVFPPDKTKGIFSLSGGTAILGLENYTAKVDITQNDLGTGADKILAGSAVLITVTVTDTQNNDIQISGYRTRY